MSNKITQSLSYLDSVLNKGEDYQPKDFFNLSLSDFALISIGTAIAKKSSGSVKPHLSLIIWMLKTVKDKKLAMEYLKNVSGFKALKGISLNAKITKEYLEKKDPGGGNYPLALDILTKEVPLSKSGVRPEQKTSYSTFLMKAYRELSNSLEIDIETLIENKDDCHTRMITPGLAILLHLPVTKVTKLKDISLNLIQHSILFLFKNLEKSEKECFSTSINFLLCLYEQLFICRGISFAKLAYLAEAEHKENRIKKSYIDFLSGSSTATPPYLKDLLDITYKVTPLIVQKPEQLKKSYRELKGVSARFKAIEFCKINEMLNDGHSLYEAHALLAPEMDKAQFYRTFKSWKKNPPQPFWKKSK